MEECLREKLYQKLNQEVPYLIRLRNTGWALQPNGVLVIQETIYVPSVSIQVFNYTSAIELLTLKKMVAGTKGRTIFGITTEAQAEISRLFNRSVTLQLIIKVRKDLMREGSEYRV